MNKKRILLTVLTALLLLPGMVHAETAEQAGEAAADLPVRTATDGSTYALTETEGEAVALTVPDTDGEGILTIGPEIDGKTVKYLDAGYIPENVKIVFLPAGAELLNKEKLEHEILVYSYKDYEMIHRQSSIMFHLTAVEPGEYALTDAMRFLPGGESEPLKQEYYEYPAELNGRKPYNCLAKKDYFRIYKSGRYSAAQAQRVDK